MSDRFVSQVASACRSIGDSSADQHGFVSIQSLLSAFRARLIARPLLVEAMIAHSDSDAYGDGGSWVVLVDSDRYGDVAERLSSERLQDTHEPRLRNSVAHELVHSLAFRPSDFGIKLESPKVKRLRGTDLVRFVETQTERLSPLLLLPPRALKRLLQTVGSTVTPTGLAEACSAFGVSKEVLVSRLLLIDQSDVSAGLSLNSLRRVAVGIGEWDSRGRVALRKWPLFANFEQGLAPDFILRLTTGQDRASLEEVTGGEARFSLETPADFFDFETYAGTQESPRARRIKVRFAFESGRMKAGSSFIFCASGELLPQQPAKHNTGSPTRL